MISKILEYLKPGKMEHSYITRNYFVDDSGMVVTDNFDFSGRIPIYDVDEDNINDTYSNGNNVTNNDTDYNNNTTDNDTPD